MARTRGDPSGRIIRTRRKARGPLTATVGNPRCGEIGRRHVRHVLVDGWRLMTRRHEPGNGDACGKDTNEIHGTLPMDRTRRVMLDAIKRAEINPDVNPPYNRIAAGPALVTKNAARSACSGK